MKQRGPVAAIFAAPSMPKRGAHHDEPHCRRRLPHRPGRTDRSTLFQPVPAGARDAVSDPGVEPGPAGAARHRPPGPVRHRGPRLLRPRRAGADRAGDPRRPRIGAGARSGAPRYRRRHALHVCQRGRGERFRHAPGRQHRHRRPLERGADRLSVRRLRHLRGLDRGGSAAGWTPICGPPTTPRPVYWVRRSSRPPMSATAWRGACARARPAPHARPPISKTSRA